MQGLTAILLTPLDVEGEACEPGERGDKQQPSEIRAKREVDGAHECNTERTRKSNRPKSAPKTRRNSCTGYEHSEHAGTRHEPPHDGEDVPQPMLETWHRRLNLSGCCAHEARIFGQQRRPQKDEIEAQANEPDTAEDEHPFGDRPCFHDSVHALAFRGGNWRCDPRPPARSDGVPWNRLSGSGFSLAKVLGGIMRHPSCAPIGIASCKDQAQPTTKPSSWKGVVDEHFEARSPPCRYDVKSHLV